MRTSCSHGLFLNSGVAFGPQEKKTATYQIDYAYNNIGALDTLTYPVSTSSYRLKLQYEYQYGHLYRMRDFNSPYTNFWTAYFTPSRATVSRDAGPAFHLMPGHRFTHAWPPRRRGFH